MRKASGMSLHGQPVLTSSRSKGRIDPLRSMFWIRRVLPVMVLAVMVAIGFVFVLTRHEATPASAIPGTTNGDPIDVIFDTSVPLYPGGYESSVSAAEDATKGGTMQPSAAALPGPDKTADVWLFKTDVGYRYGDNLVIETTPYKITTSAEAYLKNHAEFFGGTLMTINGSLALVRPAHSFEAFEKQIDEDSLVVVPESMVDTTIIEMIVDDVGVTLFGLELTEVEVVQVAESLR